MSFLSRLRTIIHGGGVTSPPPSPSPPPPPPSPTPSPPPATSAAPIIVSQDEFDGYTQGGESNLGTYLRLYVINCGTWADVLAGRTKVFIGGNEVASYRRLGVTKSTKFQFIQELCVQVGTIGSPADGAVLPITIQVNGMAQANTMDSSGFPLLLGPINRRASWTKLTYSAGQIMFVDRENGNNANDGSFTSPKKDFQSSTGIAGAVPQPTNAARDNGCPAGRHVYAKYNGTPWLSVGSVLDREVRAGNWGAMIFLFRISGTQPSAGTKRGRLHFGSYPGPAGSSTGVGAADLVYTPAVGANSWGGIISNDQDRSSAQGVETNPYDGLVGWGRDWGCSGMTIKIPSDAPRDSCPVNWNSSSDRSWIINNELSWPSTIGTPANGDGAKGAGIAGNGLDVVAGLNYIHDISNGDNTNQNHGIYPDGSVACINGFDGFFNTIIDIPGGNILNSFNTQSSGTIKNLRWYNNYGENANKHGCNLSQSVETAQTWGNQYVNMGEAGIHVGTGSVTASRGIKISNETVVGWGRVLPARPALWDDGGNGSGSVDWRNIICKQTASSSATGGYVLFDTAGTNFLSNGVYYDPRKTTTRPGQDSTGLVADPLFTNEAARIFTLQSGSPAINAGAAVLVPRTFDAAANPITGTADVGAFEAV